ncbi:MAG: hypothetical protein OEM98_17025 [Gammaproteobacteria bacterium]|nr:hypothetical protein [Gammaproteobacteria bacterium]
MKLIKWIIAIIMGIGGGLVCYIAFNLTLALAMDKRVLSISQYYLVVAICIAAGALCYYATIKRKD